MSLVVLMVGAGHDRARARADVGQAAGHRVADLLEEARGVEAVEEAERVASAHENGLGAGQRLGVPVHGLQLAAEGGQTARRFAA
jgi:hypothetical protein